MAINLKWRSVGLCVVGGLCSVAMAGVAFLPNTPALILIAVARTILGTVLGVFFVIVQVGGTVMLLPGLVVISLVVVS